MRSRRAPGNGGDDGRAEGLDILIEQERQLIARFEARQSSADAVAAAAVTGVLALAALAAAAAKTIKQAHSTLAWAVAISLAGVVIVALVVRSVAGIRVEVGRTRWLGLKYPVGLTSRSREYRHSLAELRKCGPPNEEDPVDPITVRERALRVCRERADNAERMAEKKEIGAAVAFGALALAVALTTILALSLAKL